MGEGTMWATTCPRMSWHVRVPYEGVMWVLCEGAM